jgi:hypothetical protein
MKKYNFFKQMTVAALVLAASACDKGGTTFSILPASQQFSLSTSNTQVKIDILLVVDNSFSMNPLQQRLAANFNSFVGNVVAKGFDFHLGVTTSDAYLSGSKFLNNNAYSELRDGTGNTHTGVFVVNPSTPNLINTAVTNAMQGDQGSGDERSFSSFRNTLLNPLNTGFLRPGAFLAVIILSDEDDFSGDNRPEFSGADHNYNAATLDPVDAYVSFLDTLTGSTDTNNRKYNVSVVTVLDSACLNSHRQSAPSTNIGVRYMSIADKTKGTKASICNDFATELLAIQQNILELSTKFQLDRKPIVSSIRVTVNGASVPQDATNGWTYDATTNSIIFHGTALPAQGSSVGVYFDPTTVQT